MDNEIIIMVVYSESFIHSLHCDLLCVIYKTELLALVSSKKEAQSLLSETLCFSGNFDRKLIQ